MSCAKELQTSIHITFVVIFGVGSIFEKWIWSIGVLRGGPGSRGGGEQTPLHNDLCAEGQDQKGLRATWTLINKMTMVVNNDRIRFPLEGGWPFDFPFTQIVTQPESFGF